MSTLEERIEALERTVASAEKTAGFWRRLAVVMAIILLAGVGLAAAPRDLTTFMGQQLLIANPKDKDGPYIVEVGSGGDGGEIVVRNASGIQAVRALAGKTGNELDIYDSEEKLAVRLMGGEKGGTIQLFGGKDRTHPLIQLPAPKEGAVKEEPEKP
jgi:hypothetical protein